MKKSIVILASMLLPFVLFAGGVNEKHSYVKVSTNFGTATVMLYNETPQHRDNMVKLAKANFYDSLIFHRVINTFMIQGGDPSSKGAAIDKVLGSGEVEYTIPAEINNTCYHKRGVIAAARNNNPTKASSGCQFYLVQGKRYKYEDLDSTIYSKEKIDMYVTQGGTPFLDNNYTVFGEIVNGIEMVDRIAALKTGPADRPNGNVFMKVELVSEKEAKKLDKQFYSKK